MRTIRVVSAPAPSTHMTTNNQSSVTQEQYPPTHSFPGRLHHLHLHRPSRPSVGITQILRTLPKPRKRRTNGRGPIEGAPSPNLLHPMKLLLLLPLLLPRLIPSLCNYEGDILPPIHTLGRAQTARVKIMSPCRLFSLSDRAQIWRQCQKTQLTCPQVHLHLLIVAWRSHHYRTSHPSSTRLYKGTLNAIRYTILEYNPWTLL